MSDVLARICADKRTHVEGLKSAIPYERMQKRAEAASPPRPFAKALMDATENDIGLIAEIKRASPSKGRIRDGFDPAHIAEAYQNGGATCLSVLTDAPYFQGGPEDLEAARAAVSLPVLRKDFILDPYQVAESRAIGADCILLIMAALDDLQARTLEAAAVDFGMSVLIEVHDREELHRALELESPLIGINNRNLKTMKVSLKTSIELAAQVPPNRLVVSESGIAGHADIVRLGQAGIRAFLVGETLMRADDVTAATKALLGN